MARRSASEVESNVKGDLKDAKSNFDTLHSTILNSQRNDISKMSEDLSLFMLMKEDARALWTYYRDDIMNIPTATTSKNEARHVDDFIMNLERKYESNFVEQTISFDKQTVLTLSQEKDRAIIKILRHLLDELGFTRIVMEENLPFNIQECTNDLKYLFHLFRTFRSLSESVKSMEMYETGGAAQLVEQQLKIESLNEHSQEQKQYIMDLKQQLHAYSNDVTRHHLITRQQEKLEKLEERVKILEAENKNTKSELRRMTSAKGLAEDKVISLRNQIDNIKAAYERDISKLRPIVEDQVSKSQNDLQDIVMLKTDSSLNIARIRDLENKIEEYRKSASFAQYNERKARNDFDVVSTAMKTLEEEVERQKRSKLVVVAAKIHFQDMATALEKQMDETEKEISTLSEQYDKTFADSKEMREYIRDLEVKLKEKEESEESMRKQLKIWQAEAASHDLQTQSMKKIVNEAKELGSEEHKLAFDSMQEELKEYKKMTETLEKRNKTAMSRIYELQAQLLEADD